MKSFMIRIVGIPLFILFLSTVNVHASFNSNFPFAYAVDFETGAVLLDENSEEIMEPASMTKLMTLYIMFNALKEGSIDLETEFKVSEKAWRKQGSKMFVEYNSRISVSDLLRGIIVQSGNDACIVVAEGMFGSEEEFAKEMNRVAKKLGMKNTNFVNSTGWPHKNHYTTAKDLASLTKSMIEEFPEYYPLFAERVFEYNGIKQYNRNRILGFAGVDGLKTGHTENSGYGIVLSGKNDDGRRAILVINGGDSDNDRVAEGERLMRYIMRNFENKQIFTENEIIAEVDVFFGKKKTVPIKISENIVYTIPRQNRDKAAFEVVATYKKPVQAPVRKGDKLGDLLIKKNGVLKKSYPLVAKEDVEEISALKKIFLKPYLYIFSKKVVK